MEEEQSIPSNALSFMHLPTEIQLPILQYACHLDSNTIKDLTIFQAINIAVSSLYLNILLTCKHLYLFKDELQKENRNNWPKHRELLAQHFATEYLNKDPMSLTAELRKIYRKENITTEDKIKAAKLLLAGADYTIKLNLTDKSPMLSNIIVNKYQLANLIPLLVLCGANINDVDRDGCNALLNAITEGNRNLAKWLFQFKPDVNALSTYKSCSLGWAIKYGHEDIVELLLNNVAIITVTHWQSATETFPHEKIIALLQHEKEKRRFKNINDIPQECFELILQVYLYYTGEYIEDGLRIKFLTMNKEDELLCQICTILTINLPQFFISKDYNWKVLPSVKTTTNEQQSFHGIAFIRDASKSSNFDETTLKIDYEQIIKILKTGWRYSSLEDYPNLVFEKPEVEWCLFVKEGSPKLIDETTLVQLLISKFNLTAECNDECVEASAGILYIWVKNDEIESFKYVFDIA